MQKNCGSVIQKARRLYQRGVKKSRQICQLSQRGGLNSGVFANDNTKFTICITILTLNFTRLYACEMKWIIFILH